MYRKNILNKISEFRNTLLFLFSIILIASLIEIPVIKNLVLRIGEFGYLGALVAGIFFVSTFTFVPAGIVLFFLAENFNPFYIAIIAGLGTVLGDYLIFRFFKDRVFEEIRPALRKIGKPLVNKLIFTSRFSWMVPVLGAILIASPLPDEIGIALMGLSKIKNWQFLVIAFFLNSLGILLMLLLLKSI